MFVLLIGFVAATAAVVATEALLLFMDIALELARLGFAVRQLVTAVEVVRVLPKELLFIGAPVIKFACLIIYDNEYPLIYV